MNNIIPFKKSIIFKTNIAEITDISLTHDYKVLEGMVEGEFYLSGTYKMTEASIINEEFYYNIPFSIALGDRIKKETINLKLDDFKYSFKDDTFMLNVDLNMEYEEDEIENTIIEDERSIDEVIEEIKEENIKEQEKEEEIELDMDTETKINSVESEVNNSTINNLLSNVNNTNEFTTYKVHIVRNDDTFESIAAKYNVSLDNIKEYNKNETINVGDKILVPYIYNE